MAAPGYVNDFENNPPSYTDYYEEPTKSGISLDKSPSALESGIPPEYQGDPLPMEDQQPQQSTITNNLNNAEIFHIVSMTCAVLSLVVFPLLELVPAILYCLLPKESLQNQKENALVLHQLDVIVTALCFAVLLFFIIVASIFTFGIGLIFLIFVIPFVVVLFQLKAITPNHGRGLW
mmetsp:Transcript_20242/g.42907  ORF Transcript_20242/g.42907 Transcript_20242/m.42907 type:complete len:177 (-) Transcript_20242:28-558(-)